MALVEADPNYTATAMYSYHPQYVDAVAVRFRDADAHVYLHDANYNVTALADNSGTVVERYTYYPYGREVVLDPNFSPGYETNFDNEYLYTGRRIDPLTGLQINRNRWYASHLGRWLSPDPIGYYDSKNLYQYLNARPLKKTDPIGLEGVDPYGALQACDFSCAPSKQRGSATCCALAAGGGMAGSDAGGVVCCDGRMVPCVWLPGGMAGGGGTGDSTADGIIDGCIIEHEQKHIEQGDIAGPCPEGCGRLSRPLFPWFRRWFGNPGNTQECPAYRAELDCLTRNARKCGGIASCEAAVDGRIRFVLGQIRSRCK